MQVTESLKLETPSLPKGDGAIAGLKSNIAPTGSSGGVVANIPLPASSGRGYYPSLSVGYSNFSGNGLFGIGWSIEQLTIRRRTNKGVPNYDENDEFTGPDGEVLVPLFSGDGTPVIRKANILTGVHLNNNFIVQCYRSRIEREFIPLEYWKPENGTGLDFWVMYTPDGQVHLLGRTEQARICAPDSPEQTAVWLIESSVSMTGEQIYWLYKSEDGTQCETTEISMHQNVETQRYLAAVYYGNRVAGRKLPGLMVTPALNDWLFLLILDYGERSTDINLSPDWIKPGCGDWLCRKDCFSSWEYGFEIRTRRLCRQVLMYHFIGVLTGSTIEVEPPQLVSRLSFEYSETPSATVLMSAHQVAYEPDGKPVSLPPLEFEWQDNVLSEIPDWQRRDDMGNMNPQQPYQIVDLNGEGVAGILYLEDGAWWYRAPVRLPGGDPDATTWENAVPLPAIPTLRDNGVLADLNGDGYLEWFVVTTPGSAGRYDSELSGGWQHFTPTSSLPVEYFHPQTQLADISGSGLIDMVLIGPKSLRLYNGTGEGWEKARTVLQNAGITLPVPGTDARVLVAFSDIAGSGQQHLVEVSAQGVRYWPNKGHGQFGQPVSMPGFSLPEKMFDPARLYLADINGSGGTDLIYTFTDHLHIYLNQSGNGFSNPVKVMFPNGVRYDHTCSLQLADIQGKGIASLILIIPHPLPQHWVCQLSELKPWLMVSMRNNMGARHSLFYRSSAQFWLDEKAEAVASGQAAPLSYLPFALQTLQRMEIQDEITGNRLSSTARYRHGVWDRQEREFRGFGEVELSDTDITTSLGTSDEVSMPAISRTWYATGVPEVDSLLINHYWQGDSGSFHTFTPRFTEGSGYDEHCIISDENTAFWLNRGMKGIVLRSELYGADGSVQASIPYTVTENRPQVRLVEITGRYPVVWASVAESRTYVYERISSDPQCHQQIQLMSDETGQSLSQVSVSYPRRNPQAENPYPETFPETLYSSSFDKQQQTLFLETNRSNWHRLSDLPEGIYVLGLLSCVRSDVMSHPAVSVPPAGLTLELLQKNDGLLTNASSVIFKGQQQVWFLNVLDEPTMDAPAFPPRVAFTETAVLDESVLYSLTDDLSEENLTQAGYVSSDYLFPRKEEEDKKLWTTRSGYVTYSSAEHFWRPCSWRDSLLTGTTGAVRDSYDCVVTEIKDSAGFVTVSEYDWRFLIPVKITDVNANSQIVTLDALGRVTSVRFHGTENGKPAGYSETTVTLPETADTALSLSSPLPLHQCMVYVPDSWLPGVAERLPPHVVTLTTDRYDGDPAQQVRQQVTFSDGFGRTVQTSIRQSGGNAFQRENDGSLLTDANGMPAEEHADFRWVISGRTEYDNKGSPIRTWLPYFLNNWKYVSNDTTRTDLYSDKHYYDPTGRNWQTETSKGWFRRTFFTPWFIVSEDENDTFDDKSSFH